MMAERNRVNEPHLDRSPVELLGIDIVRWGEVPEPGQLNRHFRHVPGRAHWIGGFVEHAQARHRRRRDLISPAWRLHFQQHVPRRSADRVDDDEARGDLPLEDDVGVRDVLEHIRPLRLHERPAAAAAGDEGRVLRSERRPRQHHQSDEVHQRLHSSSPEPMIAFAFGLEKSALQLSRVPASWMVITNTN